MAKDNLNYNALKGKIIAEYGTIKNFCEKENFNSNTLTAKLNGSRVFSLDEVFNIADILNINDNEIRNYFFNKNVSK